MSETVNQTTGRALADPASVVREARRLVGLQRRYSCRSCGHQAESWARIANCPRCSEPFVAAVIRRAALAG